MKKPISSHHRKNLELLHQSCLHTAVMFAGAGLAAIVLGWITALREPTTVGAIIFSAASLSGMLLIIFAGLSFREAGKIAKVLGVEETAMKYLEPKKKATAK